MTSKTLEEEVREESKSFAKRTFESGIAVTLGQIGASERGFYFGFKAAATARDKEIESLKAELADRDTVPRSRYNACNQDWLDAEKSVTDLRQVAKREIESRDKEIEELRARVKELEGMVPKWVPFLGDEQAALILAGWDPMDGDDDHGLWVLMVPPIPLPEGKG